MRDDTPDDVRLALPPDGDLRGVVEVAIAVLARRLGLDDDAVRELRSTAGEAFDDACAGGDGAAVEVVVTLADRELAVSIRAGSVDRRLRATKAPAEPPR